MYFALKWNEDKNQILKRDRNISFEDIELAIRQNKLLDIVKNPSKGHKNQYCLLVNIDNYVYIVPFVKDKETFFLKTIYPSRKYTKIYLKASL